MVEGNVESILLFFKGRSKTGVNNIVIGSEILMNIAKLVNIMRHCGWRVDG